MLRSAAGCRGLWQTSETLACIKSNIDFHTQGQKGVQEIQYEAGKRLSLLLSTVCEDSRPESGPLRLSDALPTLISGAMTEENGWAATRWSEDDLAAACNGDTLVPVEVSINGGDYRDFYRGAEGSKNRQFEAGVSIPLSFLLEHMQQLTIGTEEVCHIHIVAQQLAAILR